MWLMVKVILNLNDKEDTSSTLSWFRIVYEDNKCSSSTDKRTNFLALQILISVILFVPLILPLILFFRTFLKRQVFIHNATHTSSHNSNIFIIYSFSQCVRLFSITKAFSLTVINSILLCVTHTKVLKEWECADI